MALTLLVVLTPGVPFEAHVPLLTALRRDVPDLTIVAPPCSGGLDTLGAAVLRAAEDLEQPIVVAHGLGATVVLSVADQLEATRLVLLGPVLAVPPTEVHYELAGGCLSTSLASEIDLWRTSGSPLQLDAVTIATWIGSGLLDERAPPEVLVPHAREIPERELARLGLTRLDPRDLDHLALLNDPIAIEAARQACR